MLLQTLAGDIGRSAAAPVNPAPPLVLDLGCDPRIVDAIARATGGSVLASHLRRFPDGEAYLRLDGDCGGRRVVVAAALDRPDRQLMPVLMACDTLRELGAVEVGLVAPYLAYMRQDQRFQPGEAVSSRTFARLLGGYVDWLATVDPHLHRYSTLDEIYRIPATVIRSAAAVAGWVRANVPAALILGPDAESEQWVSDVAARAGCPWMVLQKVRSGDRDVAVSVPDLGSWRDRTPVLLDDIVSTGCTMAAALGHLENAGLRGVTCIAVHGVFADGARDMLLARGAGQVVTTNTLAGQQNVIDVSGLVGDAVADILRARSGDAAAVADGKN